MTIDWQPWPSIPPVAPGPRPRWSVMIPTYDSDDYLEESLGSVLAQDLGPDAMQIEVVDDHSPSGDPESVVRRLGGGRVQFHRQSSNVGHAANFTTCLQRSRGELVHLLHADDLVRDGFYRQLGQAFARPEVGAAFTRHLYADDDGHWCSLSVLERRTAGVLDAWLPRIAAGQRIATPSIVVRRAVYEELGGYDRRITVGGEDWEMWVRIATRYRVWFEPQPLAVYRVNRPGSLTGSAARSAALAADMLLATDIVGSYLPEHLPLSQAERALAHARDRYASWAVASAHELLLAGDIRDAARAYAIALRSGAKARAAARALALLGGAAWHRLRSGSRSGPRG